MSSSPFCPCGRQLIDGACDCWHTGFEDPEWCRHCLRWFERVDDWCPLCERRAEEFWEDRAVVI
jgi:hypothetical protein